MHTIVIRVDRSVLRYFGEQKYYNGFVSQKEVGDQVEMTFVTGSVKGFVKFYLLFAEYAEIVRPASLKTLVQENLRAIEKKLN